MQILHAESLGIRTNQLMILGIHFDGVDRTARGDLRRLAALHERKSLTGPDRVRYLNAVTSGNIRDLAPGRSAQGLLLNAQGHMLAELLTLVLEDRLLVLSHAFMRQRSFETLDKFIIMDDANLKHRGYPALRGRQAVLQNRDILRLFSGLRVSDSFLLQNNLREILFRKPA